MWVNAEKKKKKFSNTREKLNLIVTLLTNYEDHCSQILIEKKKYFTYYNQQNILYDFLYKYYSYESRINYKNLEKLIKIINRNIYKSDERKNFYKNIILIQ